eukprot:gene12013-5413_t
MNIPKEDFKLRTETTWFFKKLEIDYSLLYFWPDIKKQNLKQFNLILTDHNSLSSSQEEYSSKVVEIIDHHEDDGKYKPTTRIIEPVGSVCTLIGEKILKEKTIKLPSQISELLLGTILLDTMNLDPKFKKVKEKDVIISKELSKICKMESKEQEELYKNLQRERFSVETLSTLDLLRSDYKEYKLNQKIVGISSIKCSISNWILKDKYLKENLKEYSVKNQIDLLFTMNAYFNEKQEFFRDLLIFTKDEKLKNQVIQLLITEKPELNLEKMNLNLNSKEVEVYSQKNVGASRKLLAPLLKDNL